MKIRLGSGVFSTTLSVCCDSEKEEKVVRELEARYRSPGDKEWMVSGEEYEKIIQLLGYDQIEVMDDVFAFFSKKKIRIEWSEIEEEFLLRENVGCLFFV